MIDIFKKEQLVTHLYLRTCVRGVWGYPLFAMIHVRDKKQLNDVIDRLYKASGRVDYRVLKTTKELKKERVVYFSDAFGHWHGKQRLAN